MKQPDIFTISENYVEESLALSPELATTLGYHDRDDLLDDHSYAAKDKALALIKKYLAILAEYQPGTPSELTAYKVLKNDLIQDEIHLISDASHYAEGVFNSTASSFFELLDLMNYETIADFEKLSLRLCGMKTILKDYEETYHLLQGKGIKNTHYNLLSLINQFKLIGNEKKYQSYLAPLIEGITLPQALKIQLAIDAQELEKAHLATANYLEKEILPQARLELGVGRELYQSYADYYTYQDIDLNELYEFGLTEVERISALIHETAQEILPNYKNLSEVTTYLNNHPNYAINSKDELLAKLRAISDDAVTTLQGDIFDIDERLLSIDIKLNEESLDAAPYYLPPSEDLTRPGSAWFPTLQKDKFIIWPEVSTWYHEAIPGHHLQCGTQLLNKDKLTRYQTSLAWHSGYGEGWALYAESLMFKLGYFIDPGYRLGYLQSQALRAARIVLDLGLHLDLPSPIDQTAWTVSKAVNYLKEVALLDEEYAQSEIDRYLSAPGQAISYKVGERVWQNLYDLASQTKADFDPKEFHAYALSLGSLRLDDFQDEILRWVDQA